MNHKIKVGLVGIGSINEKAYMPVLVKEDNWEIIGAYSRTEKNRNEFENKYNIKAFDTLESLSDEIEAVIINTPTDSHFELAKFFLDKGVHVLVDKPLANTLKEAEELVFHSVHNKKALMVMFNRRYAPNYKILKDSLTSTSIIRIVKHRANRLGPQDAVFTLKDDYIHLIDTALWLFDGNLILSDGKVVVDNKNQLVIANHHFKTKSGAKIETLLHRNTGITKEYIEIINEGQIINVIDFGTIKEEKEEKEIITYPGQWDTVEKTKGFEDGINEFFKSIKNNNEDKHQGKEALKTQRLIDFIINNN